MQIIHYICKVKKMFEKIVNTLNDIVWSPALIILLIGAGIYFTIRTRCVQVRRIGLMVRLLFSRKETSEEVSGVSSFQAFCMALSGRVGTGNIVGVATAIALGGPGAVFWMWVTAFFGASTAFMESTLAQKYKFPHHSGWRGGPACYIEKGLGIKWLAVLFAIMTVFGYGLLLPPVQVNGMSSAFNNSFGIPPIVTGIVVVILIALVIVGGMSRIAHVASVITPFMAIGYVLISFVVIAVNFRSIPAVFASIFNGAFGVNPIFGGIVGSAISMGVKRGLFSNEAGQGGGAIVSASAIVSNPAKQGLVQAFSVYIDTLLVCTATALMILSSGTYNVFSQQTGEMIVCNSPDLADNYVGFTQGAVDTVFHGFGSTFVAIALAFFAFTTLMSYSFYSESSIMWLCRGRSMRFEKTVLAIYRLALFGMMILGACFGSGTVWTLGDVGIGLTTWINVAVLLILCPQALKTLSDFEMELRDKKHTYINN